MKRRNTKLLFGLFLLILIGFVQTSSAQVSISPPFATDADNNVVLTYDASQGSAGLLGESTIYAHTGVITDKSTGSTDWKYVIANWTTNLPKALLTRIGSSNQYTLNIGNIRSFYNVPAGETILKIAVVFRNSNSSKTGKTSSGGDIFIDLSQTGFQTQLSSPATGTFYSINDSIHIQALASDTADLTLYAEGIEVASASSCKSLTFSAPIQTLGSGRIDLVLQAKFAGQLYYDSSFVIINKASTILAPPTGIRDGINYIDDSTVILQLFAPYKNFVYVLGDFNNWEFDSDYQMNIAPDGSHYWLEISGLTKQVEYGFQYVIDDEKMRVCDIYAEKLLDPWNDSWISPSTYPNLKPYPTQTSEMVSVLEIGEIPYSWKYDAGFQKPNKDQLVIYELLVRDFIGTHDFSTLIDTISYFKKLGINCIELMPVNEFEGNESWGYNVAFYFAVDKYYGPKNNFKAFVDECHKNGIAVVMDMVLNHSFGSNPQVRMYFDPTKGQYGQPTPQNPWFNQTDKHPYGVGYDYNHEAKPTQDFTDRVIRFWLEEYHIDGYRFDLSKGFTQKFSNDVGAWGAYDQGRVDIWKRIRNEIITYAPDTYLILEHLGDNSEEKVLADEGFMLWGILNSNYAEACMGYDNSKADLSWGNYKARGFNEPNLVTYAESHDEERIVVKVQLYGNSQGTYSTKTLENLLPRIAAYHALLIPLKGPKMIWMGAELGYDVSIDFNGRTGNKPFKWEYLDEPIRRKTFNEIAKINRLKQHISFTSDNYVYDTKNTLKILKVLHDSMNTLIVGNFDVEKATATPLFPHTGWWYDYITGDSVNITEINYVVSLNPGEYRIFTDHYIDVSNSEVGLQQTKHAPGFEAFPNPTKNVLFLSSQYDVVQRVEVFSADGKKVIQHSFEGTQSQEQISLSTLTPGFYFVRLYGKTGQASLKVQVN